jgi:hypothetical protein
MSNTDPVPLFAPSLSFVSDPSLAGSVETEYDPTPVANPTSGPNRFTVHVPTETTRLSLGKASPRWKTDTGITGYTDSHVHFETKLHDKTVVSLGGPATTSGISGQGEAAPKKTQGYSMVTKVNAWHESELQHYLLSRKEDISVRTAGAQKRAVVQADEGTVDLTGGKQVNLSGGGVSIAAGELELETPGYGKPWTGARAHSSAGSTTQIVTVMLGAAASLADVLFNRGRTQYPVGEFDGAVAFLDKAKWVVNSALFGAGLYKMYQLASDPASPPDCVKLGAPEKIAATAGGDVSVFGVTGASLGSAGWATVSAVASASLKATAFGGVAGMYTSVKGHMKAEIASDYGGVLVGAEEKIEIEARGHFTASAKTAVHVAAPAAEGHAHFGSKERLWMGVKPDDGYGLVLDEEGVALGRANVVADAMENTKIQKHRALRINKDSTIEVSAIEDSKMTLDANLCAFYAKNRNVSFTATSGPVTLDGKKIHFN